MSSIITTEITQEDAKRDIEYCLGNAWTKRVISANYFLNNPHVYLNTSENVQAAVSSSVKEGSKILTVTSSGDYCLDSIFHGAEEVVNYDTNRFQYYVACLKYWGVLNLSYEEFCECFQSFHRDDLKFMSPELLEKAIAGFEEESAYPFWKGFIERRKLEQEYLLQWMNSFDYQLLTMMTGMQTEKGIADYAFNTSEFNPAKEICCAFRMFESPEARKDAYGYLSSKENFNALKEQLTKRKVSFYTSDIKALKDRLPETTTFDTIFLSNIPFYVPSASFVNSVNTQMEPLLAADGEISYYCQNMNPLWFREKAKNPGFEVPDYCFAQDPMKPLNRTGAKRYLDSYRLLREQYQVDLEALPAYGGTPGILSNNDVKVLVRRK